MYMLVSSLTKVIPSIFVFWFVNSVLIANQVEPNLAAILGVASAFGTIAVTIKLTGFP